MCSSSAPDRCEAAPAEVDLRLDQGPLLLGVVRGGVDRRCRRPSALPFEHFTGVELPGAAGIPADDVEPLQPFDLEVADVLDARTAGATGVDEQRPGRRPRAGRPLGHGQGDRLAVGIGVVERGEHGGALEALAAVGPAELLLEVALQTLPRRWGDEAGGPDVGDGLDRATLDRRRREPAARGRGRRRGRGSRLRPRARHAAGQQRAAGRQQQRQHPEDDHDQAERRTAAGRRHRSPRVMRRL